MNKTKKLLSVVLAIVMALSCMSMTASAAKTAYQTVDDLNALDAYSDYGQVTRLSLEERTSIVFDALDSLLAPMTSLNMGQLLNVNLLITKLTLTINLTSVDNICASFDSIKNLFQNGLFSVAKAILNFGVLENLKVDSWATGMTRAGTDQFTILSEIVEVLSAQSGLIYDVLSTGELDLGMIGSFLKGVDLSSVTDLIGNIPGLIKGIIYPLIERWDDNLAVIKELDASIAGTSADYTSVEAVANWRVSKLFTDNMSITTVKYDANGNMTSEHANWLATATGSAAPTASDTSLRYYYQINGSTMQSYHIVDEKEAEALAKDTDDTNNVAAYNYIKENQIYRLEAETEGSATYVWKAYEVDAEGNVVKVKENGEDVDKYLGTLKYYNDDSELLPGISGDDIDLTTMSAGELLYKFIPVVFENMAPVVLNGSVKKLLAEFVGVKFTYVGEVGSDEVAALADASNTFFTEEQGEYLWEWSNYDVINGNHYYRFEDQIFAGSLDNVNNYFDIINWDFEITDDFMDEFIPANDDDATNRVLLNVADFLTKVANEVLLPSAETDDTRTDYTATWTRPTFAAGNANLVSNVKALAQAVVGLAPQHIFGDDYATNERCYVELMLSDDNDTVLTGIAAHLVDMIMPSMTLPGKSEIIASGAKVGAILAAVIREFAAYLAPEYNFDALIYTSFENGTKTFVSGKDSGYWLDVILTMGINVGFEYIRAFADMGEGTTQWTSFIAYSGYGEDGKTYAAGTTQEALNAEWEGMLDYILDWALTTDVEWCWKMANIVDTTGLTIDITSAQDPWVKLQTVLGSILPVDEILTVEPNDGQTKIEHFLRDDLILGIVDLKWDHLINTIQFNGTNNYFRETNILDQLASLLKGIVNNIFAKMGTGASDSGSDSSKFELIPAAVTDFDTLANQANIAVFARDLIAALYKALITNGAANTVFPFLNFILGWKTDPQVIADPQIWTSFRDNNDYAYLWADGGFSAGSSIGDGATVIKVLNNSAGMLEKHRNSSVTDHAYDIQIKSVTSDASVNTITFSMADDYVSPYETIDIVVGGTYQADEAITVTIGYDYIGKDGQPVGGTQYTSVSFLISNLYEDSNLSTCWDKDHDNDYTGLTDVKGYVFTEDLYTTVTEYTAEIHYVSATTSNPDKDFQYCQPYGYTKDCDGTVTNEGKVPTAPASNYFEQLKGKEGGWADTLSKDGTSSTTGKMYKAKDGVTADTFKPTGTTDAEIANDPIYGAYDMGEVSVKYGSDEKQVVVDFIYYNDFDIDQIYADNKNNGYNANQGVDAATWEAYRVAWNDIVKLATYPMMTTSRSTANWEGVTAQGTAANDYVSAIMPQIPAAIEEFEAAKEAYEAALAEAQSASGSSSALPSYVQALQAEIENDFMNGKEINFQDYNFYEYFNYNDVKVAGENMYRTFLAPKAMDKYYIVGSGISEAELDLVIEDEANPIIAAGITASREENKQEDIDASIAAKDEWKMPITSKLVVEDMTARIKFYKQFLVEANMENALTEDADHLKFLEREIAHVEAQQLVESDYTEASWAKFAEELDIAKKVAAGNDPAGFSNFNSRIYDVKYNLMVAYKNLLAKDRSLIEAGGTATLLTNIETANAIFASLEAGDGAWALAADYEGTADDAYAQLISALGYKYQARYTAEEAAELNDGTKEGDLKYWDKEKTEPMIYDLYADSALEYAENDRPDNQGNQAKVNTANAALEAAIANFETTATTEPPTLEVKPSGEFEYADYVVVDTVNTNYDEYTGVIYGIDTLDQNEMLEQLGSLADALKASTGDETHIVITPNEQGNESTGALVEIVNSNGDVLETYVFVYFGDVDGDAAITSQDAFLVEVYELEYVGVETYASYVAADADGDGMASGQDAFLMETFELEYIGVDYQYNLGQTAMNNTYEWIY